MTSTNIQDAVTELFTSVSEGKSLIAAAVTDKGIETAADATFQQIAGNVAAIASGGGGSSASNWVFIPGSDFNTETQSISVRVAGEWISHSVSVPPGKTAICFFWGEEEALANAGSELILLNDFCFVDLEKSFVLSSNQNSVRVGNYSNSQVTMQYFRTVSTRGYGMHYKFLS